MNEKNISSLLDRNKCTGCNACKAVCKVGAISSTYSSDGFCYPKIDEKKCINCAACQAVCPVYKMPKCETVSDLYVYQYKDEKELHYSSSGGVFYAIARNVIEHGGYVAGCIIGEKCLPIHICTNKIDEINRMRGSKYVQSTLKDDLYDDIKKKLDDGNEVLFSGTPCQVAAIKKYLRKDYEKLYTLDLICHGVASPGVYLNYIKRIEGNLGESVKNVIFRDKSLAKYPNNHTIIMEGEKNRYKRHALSDPYGSSFYHNRILRESCYRCAYANSKRVGDITIGDFGDIDKLPRNVFSCKDGFSVVSINTSKGEELFDKYRDQFISWKIDYDYSQINLEKATHRPVERDKVYNMNYDFNNINGETGIVLKITIADRIKRVFPQRLKDKIKKIIKW